MMGKNHIVCTTAMVISLSCVHNTLYNIGVGLTSNFWGLQADKLHFLSYIDSKLWSFIGIGGALPILSPMFIVFLALVIFGTLCTDCDSKSSIIGHIVHIPVEHRTWLHAIWIPMVCLVFGYRFKILAWFGFGWLLHEFMDSFSAAGNAYLYPIVGYNKYGQAKIKKGIHNFKLYHTKKTSETIFTICVVAICVAVGLVFVLSPYFHIDIIGRGFGVLE